MQFTWLAQLSLALAELEGVGVRAHRLATTVGT